MAFRGLQRPGRAWNTQEPDRHDTQDFSRVKRMRLPTKAPTPPVPIPQQGRIPLPTPQRVQHRGLGLGMAEALIIRGGGHSIVVCIGGKVYTINMHSDELLWLP